MSSSPELLELARLHGVQTEYRDAWGHDRIATPEALGGVLAALGAPLAQASDAADALAERRRELAERLAPPVVVVWEGKEVYVTLGYYPAGSVIELSMVHRANAHTVPSAPGLDDNRCTWKDDMARWFCSSAAVNLSGGSSSSGPRIYLEP